MKFHKMTTVFMVYSKRFRCRKLAIVEFESTILAAKACYATKRIRINGKKLKASPRKPAGFKRLQKSTMEQDEAKNVLGKVSLKDI